MTDNIFVFDDIVPDWIYQSVCRNITSVPVTYGHRGLGPNQGHAFFSKVWPRYELNNIPWEFSAIFESLNANRDKLGDVVELYLNQCQINITTQNLNGGLHLDIGHTAWTMVHLICGDSGMDFWSDLPERGGTKIKEVDYKDNRCIIFPSNMLHRGLPPKKIEPRVSVGYVFSGIPVSQFSANNNILFPIFKDEYEKAISAQ